MHELNCDGEAKVHLSKRILIADDSEDIREMLQFLLVAQGYQVQVAPDASTSMSLAQEQDFDFIFLDLSLPDLGGEELIQKISQILGGSKTQLILFSARSNLLSLAEKYQLPILKKPFKVADVIKVIEELKGRNS